MTTEAGAEPAARTAVRGIAAAHPRLLDVLAIVAGAAQVCAFAPISLPAFAVIGPALLFVLWHRVTPRRAAWLGFLYGLGLFGAGVSWIYFSLHLFGEAIAPLAALLTAGFVAGMALYPALLGALLARLPGRRGWWWLGAAPAGWVLAEWLRGWVLTGFPWLLLGHSQAGWPLAGYLPVFGTFGVSWLLAVSAGALAWWLAGPSRPGRRPGLATAAALVAVIALWGGGQALRSVEFTTPEGPPLRLRLVQGNVEQSLKFVAELLPRALDRYARLSMGEEVDVVIWPETAVPTFYHRVEDWLAPLAERLAARGADLAIGVLEYRQSQQRYYNAVRRVAPESDEVYLKRHLVPFGEFMPFRTLLAFMARYITIPMSDIDRGPWAQRPLRLGGAPAAVSICYEDAFGEEVISQLPEATWLLNVSNDAWFGDSLAPHQHLEIARIRALETGRAMARSTNNGISALIDYDGRILARSPQFEEHALNGSLQPRAGATPYVRWGNYPVITAVLMTLLAVAVVAQRTARRTP